MASEQEFKKEIVMLRLELVRSNIPRGNCPYAYYSTSKQQTRENCGDISCGECTKNFFRDIAEDITKEVEEL